MPELVEVARVAAAARLRLQAVVPASETLERTVVTCTVVTYTVAHAGWAGPLVRREAVAPVASLGEVAAALVGESRSGAGWSAAPGAGPGPGDAHPDELVDVLVCTHGRRDMCCGARGTELVGRLADVLAVVAASVTPASVAPTSVAPTSVAPTSRVRLWRTSHTGGHRFAPTVVVLPSGSLWAFADEPLVQAVVTASGPVGAMLGRYRGCATIGLPAHQAIERAVLGQVGWALLGSQRRARTLAGDHFELETGSFGTWEAVVREGRRLPQPDCRTDPALSTKQSVEWVVEDLVQVS
jgi:hypothetical protein